MESRIPVSPVLALPSESVVVTVVVAPALLSLPTTASKKLPTPVIADLIIPGRLVIRLLTIPPIIEPIAGIATSVMNLPAAGNTVSVINPVTAGNAVSVIQGTAVSVIQGLITSVHNGLIKLVNSFWIIPDFQSIPPKRSAPNHPNPFLAAFLAPSAAPKALLIASEAFSWAFCNLLISVSFLFSSLIRSLVCESDVSYSTEPSGFLITWAKPLPRGATSLPSLGLSTSSALDNGPAPEDLSPVIALDNPFTAPLILAAIPALGSSSSFFPNKEERIDLPTLSAPPIRVPKKWFSGSGAGGIGASSVCGVSSTVSSDSSWPW